MLYVDLSSFKSTVEISNYRVWLNPPRPKPDGLVNVVWQLKDGSYLISDNNNLTVRFYAGVTVLTRLCGFDDRSLVTLLQNAGLPLVFAATDRPY
jgi:hypothetical protein